MKTCFNADPALILNSESRKLVFVHVGKCAGESIMQVLRNYLPDDFHMFEMHVYDANKRIREIVAAQPQDVVYLISKRDPIERFISAFNWDKHNLYLKGALKGTKWEEYYIRFPTINSLVSNLSSSETDVYSAAHQFSQFGHMGMGQSWYTPLEIYRKIPPSRTFLFDTSTLKRDLLFFLQSMDIKTTGSDMVVPRSKANFGEQYDNGRALFPTNLSKANRLKLSVLIESDISVYEEISLRD